MAEIRIVDINDFPWWFVNCEAMGQYENTDTNEFIFIRPTMERIGNRFRLVLWIDDWRKNKEAFNTEQGYLISTCCDMFYHKDILLKWNHSYWIRMNVSSNKRDDFVMVPFENFSKE